MRRFVIRVFGSRKRVPAGPGRVLMRAMKTNSAEAAQVSLSAVKRLSQVSGIAAS